jgi:uncharacterized damage-inducible protein DinB
MEALSTEELLNFAAGESNRWREWFEENPQTLDLPIDIAQTKSVREVVLHIFAVELRYAERLLGEPVTEYGELPTATIPELFSITEKSRKKYRQFMQRASDAEWKTVISFPTRSAENFSASKRKIFVHALLHGARHWAQLATMLRQSGYKQTWGHDFLMSDAME